mmetsp:Transcript_30065/g.57933  ORF Transcript_30065/g.57933 Transcript_30065/m.57933 type:complete len:232 (+) Transcript_30065:599-1294(+)
MPSKLLFRDVRELQDLLIRVSLGFVVEHEDHHLVRLHDKELLAPLKSTLQLRRTLVGLPCKPPPAVLRGIKRFVFLRGRLGLPGEVAPLHVGHGPEPRSQHRHVHLNPHVTLALIAIGNHVLGADLDVVEHALQPACELVAAFRLKLGDHPLLVVTVGCVLRQESGGQVLLVEVLEDILVLQVAEDRDDVVQQLLPLLIGHPLHALAHHLVEVQREVLGRGGARVEVDEVL